MLVLGALLMIAICVLFLYPSEPLLDISPIQRLLARFPDHRETAASILVALGTISMMVAIFLIDMCIRFVCSARRAQGALVVTSKAVHIPASFMHQGLVIPAEHIVSAEAASHAIELTYNSLIGRKVIEISRNMYDSIDGFIPAIQKLIKSKPEPVELFNVSFNKAGLSDQDASEKVSKLSALLNKPESQIRAAFKDDLLPIRQGLLKDQAAKIIAQLKARGLPVSVSKTAENQPTLPMSKLPGKLILIVPASLAAFFGMLIPGGSILWILVIWLALNQLPVKFKPNGLLIFAAISFEIFIDVMPQEGPPLLSSLAIGILALSGISAIMRNDIAKTYGTSPSMLLTLLFPILYVTYCANKVLINKSQN